MSRRRRLSGIAAGICAIALGQATVAHADVDQAVDNDSQNGLWECPVRSVPFGDTGEDVLRCLTFHFDVPDDVQSAVLYLDIDAPLNSLQDTDSLVVAVGEPFDDCAWAQGTMAGCVTVHGGFAGGEKSLVVDLLDVVCDPTVATTVDPPRQAAIRSQLDTGVMHVMLQDDTAVLGGWLDVNGRPAPTCGTSADIVPVAVVDEAQRPNTSSDGGAGTSTTTMVAAVAGIAVLGAGAAVGTKSVRKTRARRVQPDVRVEREVDDGRVQMEESDEHRTVAIGVRTLPDDVGVQLYEEVNQ